MLHGDGKNTRRYLYAGNAADAFDTILHKGKLGEIYNVDSSDEISNRDLAFKLLGLFGIPKEAQRNKIYFTEDRPFNDKRYAVNGDKLRGIGWEQRTTFEEGLQTTVKWYTEFGSSWWGDVEGILTPFPTVSGNKIQPDEESRRAASTPNIEAKHDFANKSDEGMQAINGQERLVPAPVMIAT